MLDPSKKISKKIVKKIKKLKNLFPELLLAKTGLDRPKKREKKIFTLTSVHSLGKKIPKKIAKKLKKLKNLFTALFLAKTG